MGQRMISLNLSVVVAANQYSKVSQTAARLGSTAHQLIHDDCAEYANLSVTIVEKEEE